METLLYIVLLLATFLLLLLGRLLHHRGDNNLPPSPPAIPIIGHLHLLRPLRHLSMSALSLRYGPIVFLRLGSRPALIVSSPNIVEEVYSKHDATFANRPSFHAGKVIGYNNTAMFFAPYGPHYRNLRRLTVTELLSASRLNTLSTVRTEEILHMVKGMVGGDKVELKGRLMEMTYNVFSKMLAGKRLLGEVAASGDGAANRFNEILIDLLEVVFGFNPRDFIPGIGWADLTGVERRMRRLRLRVDDFTGDLVKEHRRRRRARSEAVEGGIEERTLMDVMLSMQEMDPETYTDELIKTQIMTVLTAGSDTVMETAESTMRILLSHPELMKKARAEIDANVQGSLILDEADITNLPYLQCILKELLRLSPVMQGQPPHASSQDCTIKGYYIPRGTMVFVNVWAIHRDPELWDDSIKFKPERFEGFNGWRDGFRYFPFGAGRRACPGESLAVRMVMHVVGLLVQCFDWEAMTEEAVDLSGLLGLTPARSEPLVARYKVRDSMVDKLKRIPS